MNSKNLLMMPAPLKVGDRVKMTDLGLFVFTDYFPRESRQRFAIGTITRLIGTQFVFVERFPNTTPRVWHRQFWQKIS